MSLFITNTVNGDEDENFDGIPFVYADYIHISRLVQIEKFFILKINLCMCMFIPCLRVINQ